jgi:hypothetical protein
MLSRHYRRRNRRAKSCLSLANLHGGQCAATQGSKFLAPGRVEAVAPDSLPLNYYMADCDKSRRLALGLACFLRVHQRRTSLEARPDQATVAVNEHTQHPPLLAAALPSPHVSGNVLRLRSAFRFGSGAQCAAHFNWSYCCCTISSPNGDQPVSATNHLCSNSFPRLYRVVPCMCHGPSTGGHANSAQCASECCAPLTHGPRTVHASPALSATHSIRDSA